MQNKSEHEMKSVSENRRTGALNQMVCAHDIFRRGL